MDGAVESRVGVLQGPYARGIINFYFSTLILIVETIFNYLIEFARVASPRLTSPPSASLSLMISPSTFVKRTKE